MALTDKQEIKKPSIGILPKFIWEEQRFYELGKCIVRHVEGCEKILPDWIDEYNELAERRLKDD